ncbi:MAG: hypothetical protein P8J51_01955 [Dehalococcoidia bacterium]|nr:hypothetical protein [Dehalococcoidia bacterium]
MIHKIKKFLDTTTIVYSLIFLCALFGSTFFFIDIMAGNFGSLLGFSFFTIMGIAAFYQAYINIRDEIEGPQLLEGKIEYSWKSHGIFSMGKSSYFKINNQIFLISNHLMKDITKENTLQIRYMPYTKTILSIEILH